jgi:hypothetical protein
MGHERGVLPGNFGGDGGFTSSSARGRLLCAGEDARVGGKCAGEERARGRRPLGGARAEEDGGGVRDP